MVEVLRSPSLGRYISTPPDMMDASSRFGHMSQEPAPEEQTGYAAEAGVKNDDGNFRAARRAYSTTDFQPVPYTHAMQLQHYHRATPTTSPRVAEHADSYFQLQRQTANPSTPTTPIEPKHHPLFAIPSGKSHALTQRPPMTSLQRSYSVMDFEPIPFTHQPGAILTLPNLPPEIHYAIFDFLDPIDSTCLGLTSKHFYAVHKAMHGKIPLSARREGPNDMEWVWRNAGPFVASGKSQQNSLAMLTPRGQVYCRKCRTARCELHNHIKDWMGGLEYCDLREMFGPPAPKDAQQYCYRSSPRHPRRCGRHTRNQRAIHLT
ncbi:hypothetical protein F5Y15DRAFT_202720 [Xylariaceae sp. FL0016]|nr:hypothetical protein F5Y15DRAFT_202720 [Xylariaceae sp. FL0016]